MMHAAVLHLFDWIFLKALSKQILFGYCCCFYIVTKSHALGMRLTLFDPISCNYAIEIKYHSFFLIYYLRKKDLVAFHVLPNLFLSFLIQMQKKREFFPRFERTKLHSIQILIQRALCQVF